MIHNIIVMLSRMDEGRSLAVDVVPEMHHKVQSKLEIFLLGFAVERAWWI